MRMVRMSDEDGDPEQAGGLSGTVHGVRLGINVPRYSFSYTRD